MTDIKTKVQGLEANCDARNVKELVNKTGSIYEGLVIISKRANQIAVDLKSELTKKLEEFAVTSDSIEEVHENKEQIEISKFYERLPNPVLIATEEFLNDEIYYRYNESKDQKKR